MDPNLSILRKVPIIVVLRNIKEPLTVYLSYYNPFIEHVD